MKKSQLRKIVNETIKQIDLDERSLKRQLNETDVAMMCCDFSHINFGLTDIGTMIPNIMWLQNYVQTHGINGPLCDNSLCTNVPGTGGGGTTGGVFTGGPSTPSGMAQSGMSGVANKGRGGKTRLPRRHRGAKPNHSKRNIGRRG
tara:strand:+ start:1859 stop:2293 length:435 start_codon:yes stop_codon:yes gene_type:complete